jgi:hypothetical protein
LNTEVYRGGCSKTKCGKDSKHRACEHFDFSGGIAEAEEVGVRLGDGRKQTSCDSRWVFGKTII